VECLLTFPTRWKIGVRGWGVATISLESIFLAVGVERMFHPPQKDNEKQISTKSVNLARFTCNVFSIVI